MDEIQHRQGDAYLILVEGDQTGDIYKLPPGAEVVVGRKPGVDILITGPGVSRRHAQIRRIGAMVMLRDLGSRNGTFVNQERVVERRLEDGDTMMFGAQATIKLVWEPQARADSRRAVLDALRLGVLVLSENSQDVLFANLAGQKILDELGSSAMIAPRVREAIAVSLTKQAGERLSVQSAAERRFEVNAEHMAAGAGQVLVTLTEQTSDRATLLEVLRGHGLSRAEIRLVECLRAGQSTTEIAAALRLTEGTVRQYLSRVFAAFGVHTRTQLLAAIHSHPPRQE